MPYNDLITGGGTRRKNGIFPNFDCDNTGGGERFRGTAGRRPSRRSTSRTRPGAIPGTSTAFAPCFVAPNFPSEFGGTHFPHVIKEP